MEKPIYKNISSCQRGEKAYLFTPPFRKIFFYEAYLVMGLTLLLIAGVAWPLNNLNSTRIETGPTASFALADPFPVTDLTGSNVTVQMSASNFKRGSWTPCKTENVAPASTVNVEPEAGHVSLISQ